MEVDPFRLKDLFWPEVRFYDRQEEIIRSVWRNDETVVPAGHRLGKDFVSAFIALAYFLTHHPCRIITTTVSDRQINVLWGEIGKFILGSRVPLLVDQGGPLRWIRGNHKIVRYFQGREDPIDYLWGFTAAEPEALAGHHARHTLLIVDEASGVRDVFYERARTWAKKVLVIGNTYPCSNFFFRACEEGDRVAEGSGSNGDRRYYRRVIRIRAADSPNVKYGLAYRERHGVLPQDEIVPGLVDYSQYAQARALLPKGLQAIQLDAEFPQGAEDWMFPAEWILRAERRWDELGGRLGPAVSMGVDAAEGGDNSAFAVLSRLGLVKLVGTKTADTAAVADIAVSLIRQYAIPPERVVFDAGGGGIQHASYLRRRGYDVQTVRFGAAVSRPARRVGQIVARTQRLAETEERYAYRNTRAKLYWGLRRLLDPSEGEGIAISRDDLDRRRLDGGPSLREQMRPIPLWYDSEGRICLPPKNAPAKGGKASDSVSLVKLIGCSPDELEALLLGVYGLQAKPARKLSLVGH